jgi:TolB-like protein
VAAFPPANVTWKAIDARTLGREINVSVPTGRKRPRGGNRVRVNVQLVDAESGNHLSSERFDKPSVTAAGHTTA